jgi:hypothetical protein
LGLGPARGAWLRSAVQVRVLLFTDTLQGKKGVN